MKAETVPVVNKKESQKLNSFPIKKIKIKIKIKNSILLFLSKAPVKDLEACESHVYTCESFR